MPQVVGSCYQSPTSAVLSVSCRYNITHRFLHDISLSGTEHGTVIMDSTGYDMNLDHHRSAPYCNLFTNVDMGIGSRVFEASGDVTWGPHSAYFGTFWNLKADLKFILPKEDFAPNMTMVGLNTEDDSDSPYGWFVELLSKPYPVNLYDSMKATRAKRLPA